MAVFTAGFEAGDFDYYSTQLGWRFDGASTDIVNTAGLVHKTLLGGVGGDYALYLEDDAYTPVFGTGGRWLHFWMSPNLNTQLQVRFERTSTVQTSVEFRTDGWVYLHRGTNNLQETGAWNPGTAHWVAIEMDCANSGSATVFIDGVEILTFSGDLQVGEEGFDRIQFGSNNVFIGIDDIVITTAAEGQLPEQFIMVQTPDGNDSVASGGDYTNVDEYPPDAGGSYNESTAAGTDRFTTTSLGFTPVSIHSVTVINQATREGGLMFAQAVCATDTAGGGVTESLGTIRGVASSGSYSAWQEIYNTDPDTAAAWTSAGLDDLRIGIRFT